MTSPEQVEKDSAEVARIQRKAERETRELVRRREAELIPLWERIRLRRQQNGFGEDFEIALTRRV